MSNEHVGASLMRGVDWWHVNHVTEETTHVRQSLQLQTIIAREGVLPHHTAPQHHKMMIRFDKDLSKMVPQWERTEVSAEIHNVSLRSGHDRAQLSLLLS